MSAIYDLNIFWPEINPPEIPGVQFTYTFCQQMSFKLCRTILPEHAWITYSAEEPLEHVLKRTSASRLLIVTDPAIILCSICVKQLNNALDADSVAYGPVYNETPYPEQRVCVPYLYYNVSTFLEITTLLSEQLTASACRSVKQLDPACILYRKEAIHNIDKNTPVQKVYEYILGNQKINSGAFVHRFANYQ